MSYFPHNNQNFDDAFGNRQVPRGPPEMRNIPGGLRGGPPIDQDINSRRFDPRTFSDPHHRPGPGPGPDPRNIDMRPGNPPDFRMDQRIPPQVRGMDHHRHGDIRMDPRQTPPHGPLDPRDPRDPRDLRDGGRGDLRTYDRPPPRVDPRINFSVGLPPTSMNGPSLPPSNVLQQNHHPQGPGHPGNLPPQGHHHHPQQGPPHGGPLSMSSPFGPSILGQFGNRPSVTEIVPVHVDLATFASEPKFQQILLKVKEQSTVNYISLNRIADDLVESIVIDAPSKEAALLARNLIETHLKLQMKIKAAETRLQRVQTDLFSTQGEIAAGQMVEFMIRPELIGLAIGKKGTRIKQIETETGVSSINVSDNGHIMIYGPDSQSVQRAREQLELQEESFSLNHNQMEWMADKMNASVVADLKSGSGVMVAKVNRENCKLDVVGTNASVQTAKFLLSTQLEYIDKQIEIEANEREAREKLNAVRKQYGLTNPQWKNRTGRGDREDDGGRRIVEQNVQFESRGNSNVKGPNKGHDVVDSLVRAAMSGSSNAKGGKAGLEKDNNGKFNDSEEGPVTVEDELDALISYTTENTSNKKQNNSKVDKRPAKELVMQDTFLGANLNLKDSDSERVDLKGGKNRGKDRNDKNQNNKANNNSNNKNNGGNNDKNQSGVNNNKGNRQEIVKQDNQKGNKGKDKQPALKLINQSSPDAAGMLVIPPAPVLVVPPPPPTLTAPNATDNAQKNQKAKSKRERGKKHDVKVEEVELQDEAMLGGDEKKPNKEPMLVKLNNPFLEQKVKRSTDEQPASSRVVSIIPEGADKKQEEKRGRNRQERSDSHDLASGFAGLKVDGDQTAQKSESPPPGKANKRNRRKKGKNNEKDESPTNESPLIDGATVLKVISVAELEGKTSSFDSLEPPLPRIVKKGPPAIPNMVVVVNEPSGSTDKKEGRSDSLKDQEKSAKGSLTIDTALAIKSDDGAKKIVVSPPGLVAPPGLAKTPTPATSTASGENKPHDFHEPSKVVVVPTAPPVASPVPSTSAAPPAPVVVAPVVVSPPAPPVAAPVSSPPAGNRVASEGAKVESSEAPKDV